MYLVLCCFMGTHISPRCLSFFYLLSKIKYKWIRPSSVIDLPPDEGVGYPPSLLLPTLWKWVSLAHLSTLSHKPSLNDVSDLISSQASAPTCFAGWAGFGVFVCFVFNDMWLSPHALCIQSLNIHLTRGKLHWENSVPVSALGAGHRSTWGELASVPPHCVFKKTSLDPKDLMQKWLGRARLLGPLPCGLPGKALTSLWRTQVCFCHLDEVCHPVQRGMQRMLGLGLECSTAAFRRSFNSTSQSLS